MSTEPPALPLSRTLEGSAGVVVPIKLRETVEAARDYVEAAKAANTRTAYATAWKQFEAFRRRSGLIDETPHEGTVGLFLADLAKSGRSVATVEARLAGVVVTMREKGFTCDTRAPAIREVLKGIRNKHGRPPRRKEPILGEEMVLVLAALPRDVSGLRDRAILLIGFCGALRRSEIVGLDVGDKQTKDGTGWVEFVEEGLILHLRGKTGWREIALGRGSASETCPVETLQTWMRFGRIGHGPIFRRVLKGNHVTSDRLSSAAVADIVRDAMNQGGLRPDLSGEKRKLAFAGHSLRSGMATSAEVDEATVQKHLGHQTPAMTRVYKRRRDRFRINLTKAAGL